jgi:hypothetical protein
MAHLDAESLHRDSVLSQARREALRRGVRHRVGPAGLGPQICLQHRRAREKMNKLFCLYKSLFTKDVKKQQKQVAALTFDFTG